MKEDLIDNAEIVEETPFAENALDLDSIIDSYANSQGEETQKEKPASENTVKAEETEIDLRPKKTRKKSGRSKKSADSEIDSESLIQVASILIGALIHALLEKYTKQKHERGDFYLTESEIKMIGPLVDKVVTESLQQLDTRTVLVIMLGGIYAGKILPAIMISGNE